MFAYHYQNKICLEINKGEFPFLFN